MLLCRSCVRAAIADDALVVRVTGKTPRLWRAPLSALTNATLGIDTAVDGGKTVYRLVVNKASGAEEIARFDDVKSAERAFIKVSDRLLNGQQGMRAAKRAWPLRLLIIIGKILLWFLFLFMIAFIVAQFFLESRGIDPSAGGAQVHNETAQPAPSSDPAEGVAVPADQLFGQ